MMLLVGDIHGCYEEFQALLDKAGLGDHDPIIALGDIVDRGPASPQVMTFFQQHPQAQSLMGNHERKHVRHQRGELRLASSQQITIAQFAEQGLDYAAAVRDMAAFPLYLELANAILVHGYLEPDIPLAQQRATVLAGTMSGEAYLQQHYDRAWYELYRGEKPVIVGHRNYTRTAAPFVYQERVYGLDTSVYAGKALSGLLLPDFRLISVPARARHWQIVRRDYGHVLRKAPAARVLPPEARSWPRLQMWLAQARLSPAPTPEQQAELARVDQIVAQAQAALAQLPGSLTAQFDQISEALYARVPQYDTLPRREQGKLFDEMVRHYPSPWRQMLHRLRQGQLATDILADTLRSPAGVVTAWRYLNPASEE